MKKISIFFLVSIALLYSCTKERDNHYRLDPNGLTTAETSSSENSASALEEHKGNDDSTKAGTLISDPNGSK